MSTCTSESELVYLSAKNTSFGQLPGGIIGYVVVCVVYIDDPVICVRVPYLGKI